MRTPRPRGTGHGHRATRCCPQGQGCSTALEQGKGKSRGELLARQDAALRVCLYTARGRKNARDLAKRAKPQEVERLGTALLSRGHCRPERPVLCQENAFSCPKTSGLQPPGWFVCVRKAVTAERELPCWPQPPRIWSLEGEGARVENDYFCCGPAQACRRAQTLPCASLCSSGFINKAAVGAGRGHCAELS